MTSKRLMDVADRWQRSRSSKGVAAVIYYLYAMAAASLLGGAVMGLQSGYGAALLAWCAAGLAGFIASMWMAEMLAASRRAADALERLAAKDAMR